MSNLRKIAVALLMITIVFAVQADAAKKKVKLSDSMVSLYEGDSYTLKLKNAKGKIKWSSSKKKIATVSSKGKVKAKKKGNCKITAKVGKKKYVCKIRVKKIKVTSKSKNKSGVYRTPAPTPFFATSRPIPTPIPSNVQEVILFRSEGMMIEHYEKHGKAMGYASAEEYLAGANAAINHSSALHKKQKEDGDDIYYVETTNDFVVVSTDGYIRTYFRPEDGIRYYERQ